MSVGTTSYVAIKYFLDRVQQNPDLQWAMFGTQAFELLCRAEAMHLGQDVAAVVGARMRDLQPMHRWRRADVVVFRERLEEHDLPTHNDEVDMRSEVTKEFLDGLPRFADAGHLPDDVAARVDLDPRDGLGADAAAAVQRSGVVTVDAQNYSYLMCGDALSAIRVGFGGVEITPAIEAAIRTDVSRQMAKGTR